MLATPLPAPLPFSSQHGADGFRPAKDIDAFNKLLPPPIEFVEGSSSGAYAVPEGKYKPINVPAPPQSPKTPSKPEKGAESKSTPTTPASVPTPKSATTPSQSKSLWTSGIDISWPSQLNLGSGLHNLGNTCFLNSALQCLIHTPPLLHILMAHTKDSCRNDKSFCMTCALRSVAAQAHQSKNAFSPTPITSRLQTIAKHMRRGRQEDTHEFLRYAIDALQKSCLFGYPPKIDHKLAETTWVHKMFGGRLRSRVTCRDCGYNSDTFDRVLDLSIDIFKSDTLKDALKKFVAIDYLKGADKYKCEKCKKPVVAEKRFTIDEAPVVLTVHLKRFSPMGRKIGHHVEYDEKLTLQPYMSEGGGPNSGHYYAFVKSRDGRWYEMNDESVTPIHSAPTSKKSAYMLFYIRDKGQSLEAVVKGSKMNGSAPREPPVKSRVADGMKGQKRKERPDEDAEDTGEKVVLGPLLPAPTIQGDSKKPRDLDPQALAIKAKIEAAKARTTMKGLSEYKSDDEDGDSEMDDAQPKEKDAESTSKSAPQASSPPNSPPSSPPSVERSSGIAPSSFYGSNPGPRPPKKQKSQEGWGQKRPFHVGSPKKGLSGNPFNRLTTYGGANKRRGPHRPPRGI